MLALAVVGVLLGGCSSGSPRAGTRSTAPSTAASRSAPSASASPSCSPAGVLASWTVERLAAQAVVVPVDQSDVSSITTQVAGGAGGVILFGGQAPAGLAAGLAALSAAAPDGIGPLVMSDEEGGTVQRMPNVVGTLPSARQMGATMTPDEITSLAADVGRKLRAVGVTMDLAPVLDLDAGPGPNDADPIGSRSFGAEPATAAAAGLAFAAGLRQGGVVPVVKHFPGLGGASGNTELGPASTVPWDQLQDGGLVPFRQAMDAGIPAVMMSSARVPGLGDLPAGLSPEVIGGVLRGRLHFSGLVITDALSAGSISAAGYSVPDAAVAALAAGADMVLFNAPAGQVADLTGQTVDAIAAAVDSGRLARDRLQDAVGHILAVKGVNLCR